MVKMVAKKEDWELGHDYIYRLEVSVLGPSEPISVNPNENWPEPSIKLGDDISVSVETPHAETEVDCQWPVSCDRETLEITVRRSLVHLRVSHDNRKEVWRLQERLYFSCHSGNLDFLKMYWDSLKLLAPPSSREASQTWVIQALQYTKKLQDPSEVLTFLLPFVRPDVLAKSMAEGHHMASRTGLPRDSPDWEPVPIEGVNNLFQHRLVLERCREISFTYMLWQTDYVPVHYDWC